MIDMGDDEKWMEKLNKLRYILNLCAPDKSSYPAYIFTRYYYVEDGVWYESSHGCLRNMDKHAIKMNILDIHIPYRGE